MTRSERRTPSKRKDTPLEKKHARALRIVTILNTIMFGVEVVSGFVAHSTALKADSTDMLGDALGAGAGLMVRKSSRRKQAAVALIKAGIMGVVGLGVLASAALLIFNPVMPVAATMGLIGGLALTSNILCAAALYKYRNDNINIKSTWKCTRNDIVSNIGVLAAAGLGRLLLSPIPDMVVGAVVAGLFVKGAVEVGLESIGIIRAENRKKMAEATAAAPQTPRPQPRPAHGFKKVLRAIFNRKASASGKQMPVEGPQLQEAAPEREPVAAAANVVPVPEKSAEEAAPKAANDDTPAPQAMAEKLKVKLSVKTAP